MSKTCCGWWVGLFLMLGLIGYPRGATTNGQFASDRQHQASTGSFLGSKGGDEREVGGIKLGWCPPGQFRMGSPRDEPERRPGEEQVDVTLSKGFWIGKFETTQGQWKRVVGVFPGQFTAGEGDDFPVYTINFAEAEGFCRKLTDRAHASGDLPKQWEFRLPTEAQWEYACRAGTTTATSFGDKLSSKQANFQGRPYNGGEEGPSLKRTARVGSYPANPWGEHDMHGNVFEWCRDWYHLKLPGGVDPDLYSAKGSASKSEHGDISRVRRGGCWADEGWPCGREDRLPGQPAVCSSYTFPSSEITLAGTPTAVTLPGRFFMTTAPAPTTDHSPIETPIMTLEPIPRLHPSPTETLPARWTPGARVP